MNAALPIQKEGVSFSEFRILSISGREICFLQKKTSEKIRVFVQNAQKEWIKVQSHDLPKELKKVRDIEKIRQLLKTIKLVTFECLNGEFRIALKGNLKGGMKPNQQFSKLPQEEQKNYLIEAYDRRFNRKLIQQEPRFDYLALKEAIDLAKDVIAREGVPVEEEISNMLYSLEIPRTFPKLDLVDLRESSGSCLTQLAENFLDFIDFPLLPMVGCTQDVSIRYAIRGAKYGFWLSELVPIPGAAFVGTIIGGIAGYICGLVKKCVIEKGDINHMFQLLQIYDEVNQLSNCFTKLQEKRSRGLDTERQINQLVNLLVKFDYVNALTLTSEGSFTLNKNKLKNVGECFDKKERANVIFLFELLAFAIISYINRESCPLRSSILYLNKLIQKGKKSIQPKWIQHGEHLRDRARFFLAAHDVTIPERREEAARELLNIISERNDLSPLAQKLVEENFLQDFQTFNLIQSLEGTLQSRLTNYRYKLG